MSRTSKIIRPLSASDRAAVDAARADARARFAHLAAEADLEVGAGSVDPENPPMTDEELSRLRPAALVVPRLVEASLRRKGGRPRLESPKVALSIRLDADVVSAMKAQGPGWQGRANDVLRRVFVSGKEDDVLRALGVFGPPTLPTVATGKWVVGSQAAHPADDEAADNA